MADILSLGKARKARARVEKETKAAENRVKFGRNKAEKALDEAERRRLEKAADAHKRES